MVYTPEEKKKIDQLLLVFADYIENRHSTDIAYSEKSGYVWLSSGGDDTFSPIPGFDSLLKSIVYRHLLDEEDRARGYLDMEHDRVRTLLAPRFARMEEHQAHCIQLMEQEIGDWITRCKHMHEQTQKDLAELREYLKSHSGLEMEI